MLFDAPTDAVPVANVEDGTNHDVTDIFNHKAEHDRAKFAVDGVDQFHKLRLDTGNYRQVEAQ